MDVGLWIWPVEVGGWWLMICEVTGIMRSEDTGGRRGLVFRLREELSGRCTLGKVVFPGGRRLH